ncbi:DUF3429 family protein [Marinomonas agarivorans]|nr:DUF3429 family protein [Marinomonas agarivorans]
MRKLYVYLTYAGALPFIFCAVSLILNIKTWPWLGGVDNIMSLYALAIATFLAGSHWGQHLSIVGKWQDYLSLSSNFITVALWLAFLTLPFRVLLLVFIAAFLILLLIDLQLVRHNWIDKTYFRTRCVITAIVIMTLIVTWGTT